jgi:OPA family sugar phosphate sensor protein UhpC-like MFS transporter
MAVDMSSRHATGAAMGMIGAFSYLGAALQDTVSGYLLSAGKVVVEGKASYDFGAVIYFWIGAAVIATILPLFVWNAKPKS